MTMRNSFAVAVAAALTAVVLAIAAPPAKAATVSVTQTFDTAVSSSNAGWTTFQNTLNGNNYGWNAGNEVSGTGGQAGGIFTRTASGNAGYYADLTIGQSGTTSGTLDRATETLSLSGLVRYSNADMSLGQIRLGYFNTGTFGAIGSPFIGLRITPQNSGTSRAWIQVDDQINAFVTNLVSDQVYSFNLTWTPTAGGAGTLAGTLASTSVTLTAPAGTGVFNAFGISNGYSGTNTSAENTNGSYYDNLTYSVVPEPSTWAMAGVGVACAASWSEFRRRRRNR